MRGVHAGLLLVCAGLSAGLAWRLHGAVRAARVVDWGRPWLNWLDGLNRLFCSRYHRLRAEPVDLPRRGGAIVVANHLSGLDPLLMQAVCDRPLHFMIASEQYRRFGFRRLYRALGCIPVDRTVRPERALRAAVRALEGGAVVALFPHGKIHLDTDPPRKLRPGAAKLSELTDCPIYPLRIDGVKGAGSTVLALLPRSRARVRSHPPFSCHVTGVDAGLERLEALLNPPPPRVETARRDPI